MYSKPLTSEVGRGDLTAAKDPAAEETVVFSVGITWEERYFLHGLMLKAHTIWLLIQTDLAN